MLSFVSVEVLGLTISVFFNKLFVSFSTCHTMNSWYDRIAEKKERLITSAMFFLINNEFALVLVANKRNRMVQVNQ